MMSSSVGDFVSEEIKSNKVVVFSKSYCPFCKKTKKSLAKLGVDVTIYELDEMGNGDEIQENLLEVSGQKTVPNVFINGEHLGGNDDTQKAIKEGKLQDML